MGKAVSGDNRERWKRGQNVGAELRARNREENKNHDEPDGEKARVGTVSVSGRSSRGRRLTALRAVATAHRGPSKRREENPRPGSANNYWNEKPRAPAVLVRADVALEMLVDEEEIQEPGISVLHQNEPGRDDCAVDESAPEERHPANLGETSLRYEPCENDRDP